jgi:hypothetical protein
MSKPTLGQPIVHYNMDPNSEEAINRAWQKILAILFKDKKQSA